MNEPKPSSRVASRHARFGVGSVAVMMMSIALFVGCRSSQPTNASAPPTPEQYGPGRTSHISSVEDMTRVAAEVLARPYGLQPTAADGVVTTDWATHDEGRWPGLRTRVEVQIMSTELIVLVHCVRREREPCSRVMPDGEPLVRLARRIAHDIIEASPPDRYMARMRVFKDELCACQDDRCATRVLGNLRDWGTAHMADVEQAESTSTANANAEARRLRAAIISCARVVLN